MVAVPVVFVFLKCTERFGHARVTLRAFNRTLATLGLQAFEFFGLEMLSQIKRNVERSSVCDLERFVIGLDRDAFERALTVALGRGPMCSDLVPCSN